MHTDAAYYIRLTNKAILHQLSVEIHNYTLTYKQANTFPYSHLLKNAAPQYYNTDPEIPRLSISCLTV